MQSVKHGLVFALENSNVSKQIPGKFARDLACGSTYYIYSYDFCSGLSAEIIGMVIALVIVDAYVKEKSKK